MILAVTGTSTGVGKTIACAALAAAAGAAGRPVTVIKPAQTGFAEGAEFDADGARSDAAVVAALVPGLDVVEGRRYPDPLAPLTAARRAGLPPLTRAQARQPVDAAAEPGRLVLIEGAGGVLVRLGCDPDGTSFNLLDVAADVGAAVVVVADPALGTLNHTELTVRAITDAGLRCAGIVLSRWPERPGLAERCNREELPGLTGVPLLGVVPDGAAHLPPVRFGGAARTWFVESAIQEFE